MEASTLRILLVEDSPTDADLIQRVFQRSQLHSSEIRWVERLSEAVNLCRLQSLDLILLDLQLPDSEGMDTLREMRSQIPEIPIVVLTNLANEEMGLQAVNLGAQDYLIKDQITIQTLFRTVKYALERSRILQQLQMMLAEKETLLAEVQHRVKNSLQLISSLINLQMGQESDAHTTKLLGTLQNRIRSIATVYEMLYQSNRIDRVNIVEYLASLLNHLLLDEARVEVRFEANVENLMVDVSRATACGLILTELITNALKYAFPTDQSPGPAVKVRLSQIEGEQVLLEIQDNGVGLPPDLTLNSVESVGLSLVQALTQQLKGSLTVACRQGTCYQVYFPVGMRGDR